MCSAFGRSSVKRCNNSFLSFLSFENSFKMIYICYKNTCVLMHSRVVRIFLCVCRSLSTRTATEILDYARQCHQSCKRIHEYRQYLKFVFRSVRSFLWPDSVILFELTVFLLLFWLAQRWHSIEAKNTRAPKIEGSNLNKLRWLPFLFLTNLGRKTRTYVISSFAANCDFVR